MFFCRLQFCFLIAYCTTVLFSRFLSTTFEFELITINPKTTGKNKNEEREREFLSVGEEEQGFREREREIKAG